mmetsp:Transcript_100139/g.272220  ORF Transcript_100139/g.272220 Transcript_100139/m.272220 type:complete len:204 (-) Transcript_100139:705-1316(-)
MSGAWKWRWVPSWTRRSHSSASPRTAPRRWRPRCGRPRSGCQPWCRACASARVCPRRRRRRPSTTTRTAPRHRGITSASGARRVSRSCWRTRWSRSPRRRLRRRSLAESAGDGAASGKRPSPASARSRPRKVAHHCQRLGAPYARASKRLSSLAVDQKSMAQAQSPAPMRTRAVPRASSGRWPRTSTSTPCSRRRSAPMSPAG